MLPMTLRFDTPAHIPFALALSLVIAVAAWRAGSLSASGAIAATAVGTIALAASWGNGALLLCWFALAAALSALGKNRKAARVRDIVAKVHGRDAAQVLANGAMFAIASAGIILVHQLSYFARTSGAEVNDTLLCSIAAAAALAAAGADTWATEIGTLYGRDPWSLRSRARVPAGTSGAITLAGTLAMILGALVIALVASAIAIADASSRPLAFVSIAAGGVAGAGFDTLMGAWAQERRLCPHCELETEQAVHTCGTKTVLSGGAHALNNDVVNFLCTVVGATVGIAVATVSL